MYRLIEKLRLDRYISSRLIFALDLLVSVGASIISLLVASILLGAEALIWKTIGWWLRCLFLDRVRVAPNPQINHPSRHLAGFGPFECRRCFQGNWDRSYIGFGCRWPDISSDLDHSVV